MHRIKIYAVDNLTALPLLGDKSGINQGPEMIRERRGSHTQMLADLTDIQAIISGPHQQPKDSQAGVVTECGERKGNGGMFHHSL